MTKYIEKPVVVEAVQWFKEGDHSVVAPYSSPGVSGERLCLSCSKPLHMHGWLEQPCGSNVVCPGSWIVERLKDRYKVIEPDEFFQHYEEAAAYLKAKKETPADKIAEILDRRCAFSYGDASITLYDIANEIIDALKKIV